jgi:hypothetical protein
MNVDDGGRDSIQNGRSQLNFHTCLLENRSMIANGELGRMMLKVVVMACFKLLTQIFLETK